MSTTGFNSSLAITHIGTATALLDIDGVTFLTDPFFSPAGTAWDMGGGDVLKNTDDPALGLQDLPHVDAVLLSHEDHPDNLDELGRQILNGRHVFTTVDGANNLSPRPAVLGMKPWTTVERRLGGVTFHITATPCQHLPGGECAGFALHTEKFGTGRDGLPNVIWFTGDTVYTEELAAGIASRFHVKAAIVNVGAAAVELPDGPLQVTMDGKQAAQLLRETKAELLVPMHYESWGHFTQLGGALAQDFRDEGVDGQVKWLVPGKAVQIL